LLVVVLAGGVAVGANTYAKHQICTTLKGESFARQGSPAAQGPSASADPSTTPADTAQVRRAADSLRAWGHLLVIDRSLKGAVDGLADDVDQLADLMTASEAGSALERLVLLAASVNDHVRQAQRACGLPVQGILTS
jgi:hypothetical protein